MVLSPSITVLVCSMAWPTVRWLSWSGWYESGVWIHRGAIFSVMMVVSINKYDTRYAPTHDPSSGSMALNCPVVSSAKTMEVSTAREAPANRADMPTNAASGRLMPHVGKRVSNTWPHNQPMAAPMVSNGANVPPDVPLPRAMSHDSILSRHNDYTTANGRLLLSRSVMFS